jgi:hypothetical protein
MTSNNGLTDVIAELGRKYLWWEPVGGASFSEDRIIAQTMNLGTYDDILLLEQTVGQARLVEIMLHAQPGWINDRSWEFWRGRLSFATGAAIPEGLRDGRFFKSVKHWAVIASSVPPLGPTRMSETNTAVIARLDQAGRRQSCCGGRLA